MSSTVFLEDSKTLTVNGSTSTRDAAEYVARYNELLRSAKVHWTEHHHFSRLLGSGGQGVVYLSERRGTDGFTLPVALKIFSPERFTDERCYDDAMGRIAQIAAKVAQIQQDNLLDVHNFVDRNHIRIMVMEWIDGYDLGELLKPEMLQGLRTKVTTRRWDYLNNVIVTSGRVHSRLRPGIAINILRGCLGALAALHRENIVHGDVKNSNIMLKRAGNAKVIDIGSAMDLDNLPPRRTCTPRYAAPEVLEGAENTPRSDLASLGYVLIEMLTGEPLFANTASYRELLEAKRALTFRLPEILPAEVARNELMMRLIRGLVSPDPSIRYPSAETADLDEGAAGVEKQLVKGDLASEYHNEIRLWLLELGS